jgi:hypothetical protein
MVGEGEAEAAQLCAKEHRLCCDNIPSSKHQFTGPNSAEVRAAVSAFTTCDFVEVAIHFCQSILISRISTLGRRRQGATTPHWYRLGVCEIIS